MKGIPFFSMKSCVKESCFILNDPEKWFMFDLTHWLWKMIQCVCFKGSEGSVAVISSDSTRTLLPRDSAFKNTDHKSITFKG